MDTMRNLKSEIIIIHTHITLYGIPNFPGFWLLLSINIYNRLYLSSVCSFGVALGVAGKMSLYLATRHSPYCRKPWRESPSSCFWEERAALFSKQVLVSYYLLYDYYFPPVTETGVVIPAGGAAPADASGTRYWWAAGTAQTSPPLSSDTAYCKLPTSCQGCKRPQTYSEVQQKVIMWHTHTLQW